MLKPKPYRRPTEAEIGDFTYLYWTNKGGIWGGQNWGRADYACDVTLDRLYKWSLGGGWLQTHWELQEKLYQGTLFDVE